MTQHTLKYLHHKRGYCKAAKQETPPPKPVITNDIVNEHLKNNPDIISNYLRNERLQKAQKRQMAARSLLNNAF